MGKGFDFDSTSAAKGNNNMNWREPKRAKESPKWVEKYIFANSRKQESDYQTIRHITDCTCRQWHNKWALVCDRCKCGTQSGKVIVAFHFSTLFTLSLIFHSLSLQFCVFIEEKPNSSSFSGLFLCTVMNRCSIEALLWALEHWSSGSGTRVTRLHNLW